MRNSEQDAATSALSPNASIKPRGAWYAGVFLAVAAGAVFWLGLQFQALRREMDHIWSRDGRLLTLAGEIVHLDEVLTMSARMAAATGDQEWETRYRRFEPQLDAAIRESWRLEPVSVDSFIAQTDTANRKLVELENSVFELVRRKDQAAARAILSGAEYENQKRAYTAGVGRLSAALDRHFSAARAALRRRMGLVFSALITLLVVPALFCSRWSRGCTPCVRSRSTFCKWPGRLSVTARRP